MIDELEKMDVNELQDILHLLEEKTEGIAHLSRYSLLDRIYAKLRESAKVKDTDRVTLERALLRLLADKLSVVYDQRTATPHLAERIFAAYSEAMAKELTVIFDAALYVATGDDQLTPEEQQVLEELANKLYLHQDAKKSLRQTLQSPPEWFGAIRADLAAIKDSERAKAILSLCWAVATADSNLHPKEIMRYFIVAEALGSSNRRAADIATEVTQAYEEALANERAAVQQLSGGLGAEDLTRSLGPILTTAAALAAANATGFGIFLATTTGLHAISLLLGMSFSFATYTTATVALGTILSPVGFIGIPLAVGAVAFYKTWRNQPHYQKLLLVFLLCYRRMHQP
jgi:tellurite resistance protein